MALCARMRVHVRVRVHVCECLRKLEEGIESFRTELQIIVSNLVGA